LLFLTGPRSLFYYRNPWEKAHYYLFEHGYKVEIVRLPFQNPEHRLLYKKIILKRLEHSHIFCDRVTYQQLSEVLTGLENSTLTLLTESDINGPEDTIFKVPSSDKPLSLSYWLHQKFLATKGLATPSTAEVLLKPNPQTYSDLLDRCVHLAELDFYQEP
jgi:hypothetical protein